MTETVNFTKGAFAIYEPDNTQTLSRFIPFRFNPEGLQRQLAFEQASGTGGSAAAGASSESDTEQGADASSGTLKESFSVLLRFDLAEREEVKSALPDDTKPSLPVEFGVLPEISALEDLLYPAQSETEAPSDGSESVRGRGRQPLVLFIWGEKRVVPVKITGMTINETLFNGKLYPVRAEVEAALEVLGEAEAQSNTRVRASLDFTEANRRKMARIYLKTTSRQGTNINLPS